MKLPNITLQSSSTTAVTIKWNYCKQTGNYLKPKVALHSPIGHIIQTDNGEITGHSEIQRSYGQY